MKKFNYMMQAAALWLLFTIFRMMNVDRASACGGCIGRTVGPRLAASRKAFTNLRNALPDKTESEYAIIIRDMWDNLGRVFAEYPHLKTLIMERTNVIGQENLDLIGKDKPCIIIGGHIANWELFPFFFNYKLDWPMAGIYRAPNNPYAEKLLDRCRNPENKGIYVPKSKGGTRMLIKTLMSGGRVGALIDQKYNEGIAVPFFGRPAMTSTAFVQLAAKFNCPILPLHLERLEGCNFNLTVSKPLFLTEQSEEQIVLEANQNLEKWIRHRPGQWLWLHRRWDSKNLKSSQAED